MSRQRSAAVPFILVVLLLDTLGVGLIVPVLPNLVKGFLGGDVAAGAHYYGIFIAAYSAMQLVFAPILGGLSDRFGRRPVILLSLFGAGLDYLLMAFAPSLAWLFVGRLVAGITGASLSAATAYIADVTPAEKRAQSFGLIGAAFGLGFILGPAVGGVLGQMSIRLPFFAAAALNLVNFLYGCFILPESLGRDERRPFSLRRASPLALLANLRRHPIVFGLTGTLVCWYLSQQILQAVWTLSLQERFGWGEAQIGLSLSVVGISAAIVQGGLIRAALPRLGERRALGLGLCLSAAGFFAFGAASKGWMIYATIFPFALGGFASPALRALISREVGPSEQGELQGSLASLMSLASIVGPIVGTSLLARFAAPAAALSLPGAPFFAAASLNLIGLVLALRLFAQQPAAAPVVDPS